MFSSYPFRLHRPHPLLATWSLFLIVIAVALLAPLRAAWAQTSVFTPLGDLSSSKIGSYANSVSSDGSVVVGFTSSSNGYEAFRWTVATGIVGLGDLPGGSFDSNAASVSGNGLVVAGRSQSGNGYEAFRWTAATGIVGLGDLSGGSFSSMTTGASSDGSVLVGKATLESGGGAFRWTQATGLVSLGTLPGGSSSIARGVSSDGAVVVGQGDSPDGFDIPVDQAFRWTQATGMVGLGFLPGDIQESNATAVSSDGTVVVGQARGVNGPEAFRWTQATGMVGLGALPSDFFYSIANGVSANGAVVVGESYGAGGSEAFLWTQATGLVSLKQYLMTNFASSLPFNFEDWQLAKATGVSADGAFIVGFGIDPNGNNQAWRVRISPLPASKWTLLDVAINRTDNTSRLLWREKTGRYAVWKVSATGAVQIGKYYGPITGYTCNQIAVGPSGQTTLFWKNPGTKQAALWTLASDLSSIIKATVYNYPANYTPRNIAVDQSDNIRMTLRRTNRQLVFWTINPMTGVITGASGVYGPYGNLLDGPIAVGADGKIRLLWTDIYTGAAVLWTVPSTYGAPSAGYNYNPVAGAVAADIAVGADNKTRLQWAYTNGPNAGKIAVWKINTAAGGTGAIEVGKFYGPIANVLPLGLSVGGDNQTRQLWKYTTGKVALWVLNDPLTAIPSAYTYGPIP